MKSKCTPRTLLIYTCTIPIITYTDTGTFSVADNYPKNEGKEAVSTYSFIHDRFPQIDFLVVGENTFVKK